MSAGPLAHLSLGMMMQIPQQPNQSQLRVGELPDMLVTRDPETQEILEYHPLITFFNEIMARTMRDGHRDWLSNMEKEENAIKLWQYLDEKYLKPCEKDEEMEILKK